MITWDTDVNAPGCPGQIVNDDGRTILVQADEDCPRVASIFGWSKRTVQRRLALNQCSHHSTDGTVDCDECGVNTSEFIGAACKHLENTHGRTADDPGYFNERGDEMSTNEYTPGPWTCTSGMVWKAGRKGDGIPIARMDRIPGNGTSPVERDANARLIAAAPNLLAACEAALPALSAHERTGCDCPDSEAARLIRAAIEKATTEGGGA
jgi:hypothetical protein